MLQSWSSIAVAITALLWRLWSLYTPAFDCGVCSTTQMYNRVTNPSDMGTFSKHDYTDHKSDFSAPFQRAKNFPFSCALGQYANSHLDSY